MARQRTLRYALAAAALAAGCSNGDSSPDSSPSPDLRPAADTADASAPACVDLPSLVVAGTCNNLPFPTTRVPFTVGAGSAPSFTGGTLVDGLYAASKAEGWGVTAGSGRQMGIVIGNGGKTLLWFGQTLNQDGSGDVDAGTAGLYWLRGNYDLSVVSGNTLELIQTCLDPASTTRGPDQLLYTATAGTPPQLLLANAASPSAAVTTYERQGCP
jgi:hypothetical protein